MRNKFAAILGMSILTVSLMTGCGEKNTAKTNNKETAPTAAAVQESTAAQTKDGVENSSNGIISLEEAEKIALAEVSGASQKDLRIHLDTDDGKQIYEGSILYDNMEYDFEIDAVTGKILEWGKEIFDDNGSSGPQGSTDGLLSLEEAQQIALAEVKGASEDDLRIHLDTDDGKQIYEGSIVYNDMEYDFEIDAVTGKILEWDQESIYD